MQPTNNTARLAGATYLLLLIAPFSLLYVPNKLIVPGNAAATADKIRASELLFRMGIVCELASAVVVIFLVMILYRLFNRVNKMHASLLVILGALVSAPITFVGVVNEIGALTLLRGANFLSVFDKRQLDALAMFFIGLHGKTILVNEIFWGLWLFPFGLLIMRSHFIPRILGILLIMNGFAYLASSLTGLLLPDYASVVDRIAVIPETGELWVMLWLLIKGARVEPVEPIPVAA
jgi:glucan phosphoethanolaminetransferase (alkaline phosphatase superfamily)